MHTYFNNKVIWITGASSGIGKEMAIQLAQKGAKIILSARNETKLKEVQDKLEGDGHLVCPMDLLNPESIVPVVEKMIKQVGKIDILVNNAGVSQRALARDTQIDIDRRIMELNYFAPVIMSKALLPHFRQNKSGMFVTISSVAGKIGTPQRSAYCGSKHAIIGFMDSLRAEEHDHGIRVVVINPGFIKTNISKNALEGDGAKHNATNDAVAAGIEVDVCVRKVVRAMQKEKPELVVAKGRERLGVFLRRFFPNLLFKVMRGAKTT
ncbi:MAG: SDR family oxidoreductase [Saprospiraceae bacterium]|nr:SDR family oxidoreductase [Saprospiraceae bacterium]